MRDGTQTRKRLERCAMTLFVKKGVSATTIKDIATEAGIAEGTLYRHYVSKEELAQQLFSSAYSEISQKMKQLAKEAPTIQEKITAMVRLFCEQYDEDPILFNYLLLVQHHQIKVIQGTDANVHEQLVTMLGNAIKHKEIAKKDPHLFAAIIMGIVLQAAISRVYGRIHRPMMEDFADLVLAIMSAIQSFDK